VSAPSAAARLSALGAGLAARAPAVLGTMVALLEAMLATADSHLRTEHTPLAPMVLTAAQVLEAARDRGVPAFAEAPGHRLILLGSLGLDLAAPAIRAALIELHRCGELRLVALDEPDAARADLVARGLPADLVDASAVSAAAADSTYHAVAI
jgi:hypothetical protein